MKKYILILAVLFSCEKDKDILGDNPISGSWEMYRYTYNEKDYNITDKRCNGRNAFFKKLFITESNFRLNQCLAGSELEFNYEWEANNDTLYLWVNTAPKATFVYSVSDMRLTIIGGGKTEYYKR